MGVDLERSEAAFIVGDGSLEKREKVLGGDGFELENLGAGDEGGIDVEIGIVRGGSNEANGAAFEVGEESVLLGFVEPVNFVDKEDGRLVAEL